MTSPNPQDHELLFEPEAAELARMSPNTMIWLRNQGRSPRWAKLGRRVVYRRSEVLDWIEEQFAKAEAAAN